RPDRRLDRRRNHRRGLEHLVRRGAALGSKRLPDRHRRAYERRGQLRHSPGRGADDHRRRRHRRPRRDHGRLRDTARRDHRHERDDPGKHRDRRGVAHRRGQRRRPAHEDSAARARRRNTRQGEKRNRRRSAQLDQDGLGDLSGTVPQLSRRGLQDRRIVRLLVAQWSSVIQNNFMLWCARSVLAAFVFSFLPSLAFADLEQYLRKPEPEFAWSLKDTNEQAGDRTYNLQFVSQNWQGITWRHQLQVYQPKVASPNRLMFLWVTGGSPRPAHALIGMELARKIGAPVAFLFNIPNQPLLEDKL